MSDRRVLYLGRQLLDHEIASHDGQLVGKVDDLELDTERQGPPTVSALLTGQIFLGARVGGRLGAWMTHVAQRLRTHPGEGPRRFDISTVTEIGATVRLGSPAGETAEAPLEAWVRERFIKRIPGA